MKVFVVFAMIIVFILVFLFVNYNSSGPKRFKDLEKGDFWIEDFDSLQLQNLFVVDTLLFGNTISMSRGEDYLYCLSLNSGKVNWKYPVEKYATQPVEHYKNEIYFSTYIGEISKLSLKGQLFWEHEFNSNYAGHRVNPINGNLIVNSVVDGAYELDEETGEVVHHYFWPHMGICALTHPLFFENQIIFGNAQIDSLSSTEYFIGLDYDTKELLWKHELKISANRSAFDQKLYENYLVFGEGSDLLKCISTNTGELIWYKDLTVKEDLNPYLKFTIDSCNVLISKNKKNRAFEIKTGNQIDNYTPLNQQLFNIRNGKDNYQIIISEQLETTDLKIDILKM